MEEKLDIIRKKLYQEPNEDGDYFGSLDLETYRIASDINCMNFKYLERLSKAIKIISNGIPRS